MTEKNGIWQTKRIGSVVTCSRQHLCKILMSVMKVSYYNVLHFNSFTMIFVLFALKTEGSALKKIIPGASVKSSGLQAHFRTHT